MAKLREYNDHYCESQYEYAFIQLLEAEDWNYISGKQIHYTVKVNKSVIVTVL